MPFQGGLIAPALLEPAAPAAGASTTRQPGSDSTVISGAAPDILIESGSSFTTSPIVLRDSVLESTFNGAAQAFFRINPHDKDLTYRTTPSGVEAQFPGAPLQWHDDTPAAGGAPSASTWSVRVITISGDGFDPTPAGFGPPFNPTGDWFGIDTERSWWTPAPGGGGTSNSTAIVEIAATADLGTILARATIQVIHHAP